MLNTLQYIIYTIIKDVADKNNTVCSVLKNNFFLVSFRNLDIVCYCILRRTFFFLKSV